MARKSINVAFLVLTGLIIWYIASRPKKKPRLKSSYQQTLNPGCQPVLKPPMVTLENGLLEIHDYNAWFDVLPRAVNRALEHNIDAEAVLAEVFSSILPGEPWPPPVGSPQRWQWQEMVKRTRALLETNPPPPEHHQGLYIVPSSRP